MALKTIMRQYEEMQKEAKDEYIMGPFGRSDPQVFQARLEGPPDTPYEGGVFWCRIDFPDAYPFKPPRITMRTRTYHPNIGDDLVVKLDMIRSQWTPARTISMVLQGLLDALKDPDPDKQLDEPADQKRAEQWKTDREKFNEKAREYTKIYAKDDR